jgi:hypothetical protein
MLTGPAANDFVACRYGVRYPCTPSPHTPLFYGCPAKDRRIWGNMTLGVASSLDMKNWTVESYNIVPEMNNASATMWPAKEFAWFMPTIVRNATHFALWYYIDKNSRGVAVSSSPTGPFAIVHDCIANLQLGSDLCVPLVLVVLVVLVLLVLLALILLVLLVLLLTTATLSFFWTGSDGDTYMKHNGGCNGSAPVIAPGGQCTRIAKGGGVCVAKLAKNLTSVLDVRGPIPVPGEGGGIFERNGRWYIMQGSGCCFCWAGDDAVVFESTTGPYG